MCCPNMRNSVVSDQRHHRTFFFRRLHSMSLIDHAKSYVAQNVEAQFQQKNKLP
jgi:hypothetical protein